MTTTRTPLPARQMIPALAAVDAALTAHADAMPPSRYPESPAQAAERVEWAMTAQRLAYERDRALAAARPLLCWKCEGRGVTQFRHRLGGVCFSCKGDGWSARGRKARS